MPRGKKRRAKEKEGHYLTLLHYFRYIICDKLRFNRPQAIIDYLLTVNQAIKDEQTLQKRVCGVVELGKLQRDEPFLNYLRMRNMK
jgi:hypothetical protein